MQFVKNISECSWIEPGKKQKSDRNSNHNKNENILDPLGEIVVWTTAGSSINQVLNF